MKRVDLRAIEPSGDVSGPPLQLPEEVRQHCEGNATFYRAIGFAPPWIGYAAVSDGMAVGMGSFKGAPQDGRVEIAYFTLPELEGRGYASATARELVRIAREADPRVMVAAQTLPEPNASNALLRKIGFIFAGAVQHPEDGEVWEWQLPPGAA